MAKTSKILSHVQINLLYMTRTQSGTRTESICFEICLQNTLLSQKQWSKLRQSSSKSQFANQNKQMKTKIFRDWRNETKSFCSRSSSSALYVENCKANLYEPSSFLSDEILQVWRRRPKVRKRKARSFLKRLAWYQKLIEKCLTPTIFSNWLIEGDPLEKGTCFNLVVISR